MAKGRIFIPEEWNPKDYQSLVDELNRFAWKLIAEWNNEVKDNAGFSPPGLAILMLMMASGAAEVRKS